MALNADLVGGYYPTQRAQSTSNTSKASTTETSPEDKTSLDMNDFYELLAAQMKYQDADNPLSTSEMVSQMAQTQMIVATQTLIESINQMSQINLISYSSSMLGKEVKVALKGEDGTYAGDKVGVVEGVALYNGTPQVYIDGEPYELSQLMGLGEVPSPPDENKKPSDGTNTDTDNATGTGDQTNSETKSI